MSIEMDNPETLLEKIDAAANLVEQVRVALRMRDYERAIILVQDISELLFEATRQAEE